MYKVPCHNPDKGSNMKKASLNEFENDGTKSLREICNREYVPLQWLIPGIIPLDGVTMIVGNPKAGKSMFVLNVIISYLMDDILLSFFPPPKKPIKVLYLDLEGSRRRIKERSLKIIGDNPYPINLFIANSWPRFGEGGLIKLKARLSLEHFGLIIIDVLGKIQSIRKISNIHSYSLDQQEIERFSSLCKEFQTSVILVHHTRKTKADDWIDMVSGSHGVSGAVDTLLYIYREKGKTDAVLHVTGRDVEEESYRMGYDGATNRWEMLGSITDLLSAEAREQQRVLNVLNAYEATMTPKQIAVKLGKSTGSVKMLLANLLNKGMILKESYGHYAKRIL